jgi:hypothetical protein
MHEEIDVHSSGAPCASSRTGSVQKSDGGLLREVPWWRSACPVPQLARPQLLCDTSMAQLYYVSLNARSAGL